MPRPPDSRTILKMTEFGIVFVCCVTSKRGRSFGGFGSPLGARPAPSGLLAAALDKLIRGGGALSEMSRVNYAED